MTVRGRLRALPRARKVLAIVGALALGGCAVLGVMDATRFFAAWLVAWLFVLGIALASLAQVMIHELTGGHWGRMLRPPLEAAAATLPLLALLALPLAFGLPQLFPWARPEMHDPTLQAQRWYLSPAFFLVRNGALLIAWSLLAVGFLRATLAASPHARRIAVAGLLIYLFSVTLAAFDWIVSLVPGFYSTAMGVRLGAAQFVASLAFAVPLALMRTRAAAQPPARDLQDFGNLLLTYAMTWAYIAFTQYLIVWGEDLPAETAWYWPRATTTWSALAIVVTALVFVIPVITMLFRRVKRSPRGLAIVCVIALIGQWLDTLWLIAPSLEPQAFALHVVDVLALIGMGSVWLLAQLAILDRLPARSAARVPAVSLHG